MKVAVVGCGLIGLKRAKALPEEARLVAAVDLTLERAEQLAAGFSECKAYQSYTEMLAAEKPDIVVVATAHASLAEISFAAIQAKAHVLVEKPAAKSSAELLPLIEAASENNVCVHIGFNHRYHRSFQKARALIDEGAIGPLMFLRARYGHGGRIGYDKEWRADPQLSGGGELIDQGVHLVDLARWFLGDFTSVQGFAHTYYWDMPVEDNGFLLLRTEKQQTAFLHASCTEWKNTFNMEIYGRDGKLDLNGLGGSYGVERITYYKMLPEMGPPETYSWEYPMQDNSWAIELADFIKAIKSGKPASATLEDAYAALKAVENVYQQSEIPFYKELVGTKKTVGGVAA